MSAAAGQGTRRLATAACCLALVVVTFAVYAEVRLNGFVWDTVPFVVNNPWVHHPNPANIVAMFTRYWYANWQPLVWLSHALDFALFDDHAALHHFSNVAYHAVDACLVFWLCVRVLEASALGEARARTAAFIAALVFAVHPQHVQSVAWLVERKDTLYVLFTLLCFITYLGVHRGRKTGWRAAVPPVMLALALMAKPMAVTVPVALLLLDVYPLGRWRGDWPGTLRLIAEKWPYWLMSAGVIAITLHTQQMAMVSVHNLPVWVRPLTAINNSLFYVARYLWPVNLSPFYPYARNAGDILRVSYWLPGLVFLLGSGGVGLWLWLRGVRWPLLVFKFYLVTLLPVLGLVAVGPSKALDYYSYLATAPVGLVIAVGIVVAWDRAGRARSVVAAFAAAWLLALALISFQQVKFWRNGLTLWTRAAELYPASPFINRNLSGAYLAIGDYRHALEYARKSAANSEPGRAYLKQLIDALRKHGYTVPND